MNRVTQVVLGVTGSIAAYKAAELVRLMKAQNWRVTVVMTQGATQFVSELTFRTLSQEPVGVEMFAESQEWLPEHISFADRADVMVVAPCTANVMAKIACGIADDLLTCTVLATAAPLVLAPAMNVKMWDKPVTRANVRMLLDRGVRIVDVGSGDLACGYQGKGRMASLEAIMGVIGECLGGSKREMA